MALGRTNRCPFILRWGWCRKKRGADGDELGIVAPIRYVFDHPPSWPLVAAISGLTALLLFFEPIYRFLSRLRKGPLGTEAHDPLTVTRRSASRPEDE